MLPQTLILVAAIAAASPLGYDAQPYANVAKRQASYSGSLTVDLGYSVYQGYQNASAGLNIFQGSVNACVRRSRVQHFDSTQSIRFAQPPTGSLRWQPPKTPQLNRTGTIQATAYAPTCPQSPSSYQTVNPANETEASEDCLFVGAPSVVERTAVDPM